MDKYKRLEPLLGIFGQTLTADNLTKAANFVKGIGSFALKPSTHAGLRQISSGVGKLTSGYGLKNSTGAVKTFTNTMTKRGGFVGLGKVIMDSNSWKDVFSL